MQQQDSTKRILLIAVALCLLCSVMVSAAAVLLQKRQNANRLMAKQEAILRIARLYDPARPVAEQFSRITPKILDTRSRWFADNRVSKQTVEDSPIPPEKDKAGIRFFPRYREIYLVAKASRLEQIILPIYGKGLWSTMYGYIALSSDCNTITGFGFYEHGETPGLGGEIDNPRWLRLWSGKQVYDPTGALRIEVAKGKVDPISADARYHVDGISGASLTTRGVSNLLTFWLGEEGYAPFLARLRAMGGKMP